MSLTSSVREDNFAGLLKVLWEYTSSSWHSRKFSLECIKYLALTVCKAAGSAAGPGGIKDGGSRIGDQVWGPPGMAQEAS